MGGRGGRKEMREEIVRGRERRKRKGEKGETVEEEVGRYKDGMVEEKECKMKG